MITTTVKRRQPLNNVHGVCGFALEHWSITIGLHRQHRPGEHLLRVVDVMHLAMLFEIKPSLSKL